MTRTTDTYSFDLNRTDQMPYVLDGIGERGNRPSLTAYQDGDTITVEVSYEENDDVALSIDLYVYWADELPQEGGYEFLEQVESAKDPENGSVENIVNIGVWDDATEKSRKFTAHLFTFEQDDVV